MNRNTNLNKTLAKVVEDVVKSKSGKKSEGTRIEVKEVSIPAKYIASFSF